VGIRGKTQQEVRQNYVTKNFTIVAPHANKYYQGDRIPEDKMGGTCGIYGA
jgi:hypothetical protein